MERTVRSFVIRGGRLTAAQQRALDALWPRFGLDAGDAPYDLDAAFGRAAPRILEIGFGNGDHLAASAARHPEIDFVGVEVHPPGVGRLLLSCEASNLTNLRVVRRDAVEVLAQAIGPASLDEVWLYFPDPWPKKRHHKRRLVQAPFVALVAERLKPGGAWRLATDWEPYAEHMLAMLSACPLLENGAPGGGYLPRPDDRAATRFERRGTRLGHEVRDLVFRRRRG
jgi:tRNA (guanine-N7-)-methyltransferase